VRASKASIVRSVDRPDPSVRIFLFHGPDEAQSRALGARLLEAFAAAKFVIISGAVKSDPAALADEAGALSLFGGKRVIWIEPAGDEITAGVEALLEGPATESPVVAIAGALRKTSALLKLAESSPQAVAYASYVPEGVEAERMVADVGRRYGLKISPPVAARLADSCGNDQAIVAQELQKLALYIDASPQAPRELDHEAIEEPRLLDVAGMAGAGQRLQLAMGDALLQGEGAWVRGVLAAASVDCGRAVSSAGGGINWAFACAGCGGTRGAAAISEHAHRSV